MSNQGPITHCAQCKQPLATPGEWIGEIPVGSICDPCLEQREAEYRAQHPEEFLTVADKIRDWWDRFCPDEFHKTDLEFLETHIGEQLEKLRKWHPANQDRLGKLLIGPSGAGKTRSLFLLMQRLSRSGIRTEYWAAEDLRKAISDSYDRKGQFERLKKRLFNCQVLAIDDLGQEKMTETVAEFYFGLFRSRGEAGRPNLITSMHTAKSLTYKFAMQDPAKEYGIDPNMERALAIVRRISDYTEPVPYYQALPEYHNQPEFAL